MNQKVQEPVIEYVFIDNFGPKIPIRDIDANSDVNLNYANKYIYVLPDVIKEMDEDPENVLILCDHIQHISNKPYLALNRPVSYIVLKLEVYKKVIPDNKTRIIE